jgi:putative molybdopterin biosynthesis protein
VGLGIASAAHAQGLEFLPLMQEAYWLVCHLSALESPAVLALRALLQAPVWQQQLSQLMGYTVSLASGDVQSLKHQLPWWHFKAKRSKDNG